MTVIAPFMPAPLIELLKSEGWQYLTHSGGYRRVTDPEVALKGRKLGRLEIEAVRL